MSRAGKLLVLNPSVSGWPDCVVAPYGCEEDASSPAQPQPGSRLAEMSIEQTGATGFDAITEREQGLHRSLSAGSFR